MREKKNIEKKVAKMNEPKHRQLLSDFREGKISNVTAKDVLSAAMKSANDERDAEFDRSSKVSYPDLKSVADGNHQQ